MAMAAFSTFRVPERVAGSAADRRLGQRMIRAWQEDGIFQVVRDAGLEERTAAAMGAAREFFRLPPAEKAACVNDLSYSGYIASGEELTAGLRDHPEIFTITRDFAPSHPRVRGGLPCHGPVPWPCEAFRAAMEAYLGGVGGLGEHTDYGLLVIAAQDEVGGLYVRPPLPGEQRPRNWRAGESSAGLAEEVPGWRYVTPVPGVLTVFPGDILQFLTGGVILSTPHKVRLADRERFTLAYFHEPHFDARIRPLVPADGQGREDGELHYGRHFTQMFMRCYPDRATTRRITAEGRIGLLR
ncbi:2-oxoglutarate and iron-dependent oxygenase domain-containing protein [Streptomyces sp. NPDC002054]|uniref:2-oxoglutarate and iron-dependent oxygenase domain-containing protein n=1 Tax=Streptomyces sp. NPDC002054 TaxID=3154663 RepID=UPI003329B193